MPSFFDIAVHRDQYLLKEGDVADRVYIIVKGDFKVTKRSNVKVRRQENAADIIGDPQRAVMLNN